MRSLVAVGSCLAVALALGAAWAAEDKDEKPKHTIKEVMKSAHKDGLLKKVLGGSASDDEKAELLELYESLGKNEPPKGDADEWKTRCEAIVEAAQGVVDDTEDAAASLEKATNCAACHKEHKGS